MSGQRVFLCRVEMIAAWDGLDGDDRASGRGWIRGPFQSCFSMTLPMTLWYQCHVSDFFL